MTWLRRRLRSVSFQSGLISAGLVGGITTIVALIVVSVLYGFVLFTTQSLQLMAHERGADQIELGSDLDDLDLALIELNDDSDSFWAVFRGDELARSGGAFDDAVIAAPLRVNDQLLRVESGDGDGPEQGVKTVDGRTWIYYSSDVEYDGVEYTVVTATDDSLTYGGFLWDALPIVIPVVLVTALAAGFITGLFSRLALRSVEKMRIEVQQISRESLDRRVPATGAGDGIDKLAHTMNEMLARLEASSNQQNEFLASASHELRSPVAGLLAQLDVAAAYPDRVDADALLPKLRTEAQRLQLLVDDLLYLGRSEALHTDRPVPTSSSVDVTELLEVAAAELREHHRALTISVSGVAGVRVAGHERDLTRAIRNLAENAARHATSAVDLAATVTGSMAVVTVRDDGAGVPAEQTERIFDSFVRLDEARARDDGGSGLGLAIVREIANKHGGGVSLIDQASPGATFQLLLPTA